MEKAVQVFRCTEKKVSALFVFNFVLQQFCFYVSLCEINCSKIKTIGLAFVAKFND